MAVRLSTSRLKTKKKSLIEHDDNLAEYMEESDLQTLANDILDYVDEDRKSRSDWESMLSQGLTYLGLKIEDRSIPIQRRGWCI
jgi:hypothetical protein